MVAASLGFANKLAGSVGAIGISEEDCCTSIEHRLVSSVHEACVSLGVIPVFDRDGFFNDIKRFDADSSDRAAYLAGLAGIGPMPLGLLISRKLFSSLLHSSYFEQGHSLGRVKTNRSLRRRRADQRNRRLRQ